MMWIDDSVGTPTSAQREQFLLKPREIRATTGFPA